MTTKNAIQGFDNPFRPGAGHMPPYLAGRENENKEFNKLLGQKVILQNLILTGLRGLGKTVLLDTFKPMAIQQGWLWAGTDLSESTCITEENLAIRLLTDLSLVTSSIVTGVREHVEGFARDTEKVPVKLDYSALVGLFGSTPGLISDKLKAVLEYTWRQISKVGKRGIVFAYDEAQNLADHAAKGQFPLSILLDVFQSIQRKEIPFMLALTGLPTLFPKLVEARTYSERMFHVVFLDSLNEKETTEAIEKPLKNAPVKLTSDSVKIIWEVTHGYPYFVQYVCKEVYDIWIQCKATGNEPSLIPVKEIIRKLDTDFFDGRWARATDRQRDLLRIISKLPNCDKEFAVQEIVEHTANKTSAKPFSGSSINQMLVALSGAGLVYKNRHGRYSFAVPLLGEFINRQQTR